MKLRSSTNHDHCYTRFWLWIAMYSSTCGKGILIHKFVTGCHFLGIMCDRACENRACGLYNLMFQTFGSHSFSFQYGMATNFLGLLIIYLALQHCLQNQNTTFQYWDMSHQMTWYILAHMPYFCRPNHILLLLDIQ